MNRLLLGSLDSSLGDLTGTSLVRLGNGLDDTDGNGLTHVTDGETTERWVLGESLNTHGLGWHHLEMAASPDLMNLGWSSMDFPVRRSIFSRSSENLQAMWAVWQSRTGAYPAPT